MAERERETIYWQISLFLIVLSPVVIYLLLNTNLAFTFHPLFFTIFLMLSIPLTFLLEIGLSLIKGAGTRRFWLVEPSVTCQHKVTEDLAAGMQKIRERLLSLGFSGEIFEETPDATTMLFRKAQTPPVNAFLEHAFWGQICIKPDPSGIEVYTTLTFGDTLILETGELNQTRTLCEYLALKTPTFTYENVPLTLYCGLNLAFITTGLGVLNYFSQVSMNAPLFAAAAGTVGMIVIILLLMLRDREHLFGYRLAFAGLYLASLPYVCLLVEAFS